MMNILSLVYILFFINHAYGGMPLFDYINLPDNHYKYEPLENCSYTGIGWRSYGFNMTSQKWLDESLISRPIWWHYFYIIVSDVINPASANKATIYVSGGKNTDRCPGILSEEMLIGISLATQTQSVTALLFQIPNAPTVFYDDPNKSARSEDSAIAWTWKHFLEDQSNPFWLMRLPMVKSVVRAMDTVTSWSSGRIQQFIISGGSKRGWVTWLTGAVDSRVVGIVPLVLDELNFVKNMHHHFRAYGGWSWILNDYWSLGVLGKLDTPQMDALTAIVDPIRYADLLTLPKLIVSSTGDEFLVTDNVNYFWNQLEGEKHFHTMPNCEHTLLENLPGVIHTVSAFIAQVFNNVPRPQYKWNINSDGSITFVAAPQNPPSKVLLWKAYTIDGNLRRDFRLVKCAGNCTTQKAELHPVLWTPTELYPAPGTQDYQAWVDPPASGWVGFIIEAYFPTVMNTTFSVSSAPSILPNTFPYDDCTGEGCQGTLV